MNNLIGFEGLGLGYMSMDRVAISNLFGTGIDIYWYAIIITCGMILAMLFALNQAKHSGLSSDNIIDVCLFGVPISLLGARLYYVLFTLDEYETLWDVLNFRNGGLAIYGGILAAIATAVVFCKVKKLNLFALMDVVSLSFLIGQCIGRWGNFVNAEAYGRVTDLPWGMTINGRGPYHPTFFYESLWNLVGFVLLFLFFRKLRKKHGEVFFLYMAWYGLGRAMIEGLRTDSLYIGSLRVSQLLAAVFCVAGIALFVLLRCGVLDRWALKHMEKKAEKEEVYVPVYKPLLEKSVRTDELAAHEETEETNEENETTEEA